MVIKKNNIVFAAIVSVFSFFTVAYVSCGKGNHGYMRCEGVVCQNDGFCHVDSATKNPVCVCPTGFEGGFCENAIVDKWIGTWDIKQVVLGSDSSMCIGNDTSYVAFLKKSSTPTTFFIDNFLNNPYYNNIICKMDSVHSVHFDLDTLSAYHMIFNNLQIVQGYGTIEYSKGSSTLDSVTAIFVIRFKNKTTNWEVDTLGLTMKPHKM